jgi:glycosyltransferase involved in cell wall biosynthesis
MTDRGNSIIYIFPKEAMDFDWIRDLRKQNDSIFFISYRPYSLNNYKEIKKILRDNRINLIYSHMCGWDITAHLASPATPIIWHMRMGVNVIDWKKRLKNWLKIRVLGYRNTYHIAVSKPVADAINSLKPKYECQLIYNSLDFSRLKEEHRRFPLHEPYKMLIFGWQPYVKGLDITLSACEHLNAEDVRVQLIVSSQEKTYEYIEKRYSKKPEWLILIEPTNDIAELYESVDMMVSASRTEGFSFSLAEAIYSGLPVIYSDIPGTNWANDFNGTYLFQSENYKDEIRAIEECIANNVTRQQQIDNQVKMRSEYSMDSWTRNVLQYIEIVMEKKNERRKNKESNH